MVNMFRWLFNRAIQPTWFYRSIEGTELDTWPSRRDSHAAVRRKLRALGYRPVGFGEHPKEGTKVVNCNNLHKDRGSSQGNWLRTGVISGHWRKVLYDTATGNFDHHKYSDPYFSHVFWVYDETLVIKEKGNMKFLVIQTSTWSNWVLDVHGKTYNRNSVFETSEMATDIAKRLAEKHSGYEFFVVKAITSVMKSCIIVTPLSDD